MDTQDTATRLAYTRTRLANERTCAAWLRAGSSLARTGSPPPAATRRLVLTLSALLAVLLATGVFLL